MTRIRRPPSIFAMLAFFAACEKTEPGEGGDSSIESGGDDTCCPAGDSDPSPYDSSISDDTDEGDAGGETGEPDPEWIALPGDCTAPDKLPPDPLERVSQITTGEGTPLPTVFMEAVDAVADWDAGRLYVVGQGGFLVFDFNGSELLYAGTFSGPRQRYYKVAALGDGLYAAANRDFGFNIISTSGFNPSGEAEIDLVGASALAAHGELLYVGTYNGELVTFDLSNPTAPVEIGRVSGLDSPWDMTVAEGWLYVADNGLGIVPVNLADPENPVVGAPVTTGAAPQSVSASGGTLYAAVGSAGIEAFSLADPAAPAPVSSLSYGAAVVDVWADGGLVWGVNHEDVVVADFSDPASPVPLAAQETEEWAMCVVSQGETALVGDWGNVDRYQLNADTLAPEADPSRSDLYFYSGSSEVELTLANRGGDTLHLLGGGVEDPRFTVTVSSEEAPPGGELTVRVEFADDGELVGTSLCLATDDPDEPLQMIPLASSSGDSSDVAVGEDAIDFALTSTDGETYRLSEQLGHPVVLVYFATW